MAESTSCRYGWGVCRDNNSNVILVSVISASAFAYIIYLTRFCSREKRFNNIRWAITIAVSVHYVGSMLDHFLATPAIFVGATSFALEWFLTSYAVYRWVYNIVKTLFRTINLSTQTPRRIMAGVWVILTAQTISHTILFIGSTSTGASCQSWLTALSIADAFNILFAVAPLVFSYGYLWYLVKGHVTQVKEIFPYNDIEGLEVIKRKLGRTTMIASLAAIVFFISGIFGISRAQSTLGRDDGCETMTLVIGASSRIVIFFAPLAHTHVRPQPVSLRGSKSPVKTGDKSGGGGGKCSLTTTSLTPHRASPKPTTKKSQRSITVQTDEDDDDDTELKTEMIVRIDEDDGEDDDKAAKVTKLESKSDEASAHSYSSRNVSKNTAEEA